MEPVTLVGDNDDNDGDSDYDYNGNLLLENIDFKTSEDT